MRRHIGTYIRALDLESGKFAKGGYSRRTICLGRLNGRFEISKMAAFIIDADQGGPSPIPLVPMDTLEAGRIVLVQFAICPILGLRRWAQIAPFVI